MRNQLEGSKSNIVSIFARANSQDLTEQTEDQTTPPSTESFDQAMKRNHDNQERLRKERLKANQSVLKSYRIKN